ncbi:dihydrofolate reductase family protein [Solirubrobacter ginsenosidimutans]|uniref:Dihydrofolate reductase family protein n=1 Tax=Solirubrobacter ginsenosidimutans TaxID=490573 RepID=A0A9X3S2C4_9ACTN|nr:dihydrofolate reductase family protein [Solirubrobacter ginsenosidimutans]MDA0161041.1 dihydrofolate reductase family protein [Solirubrobacter ginsenosidimutans]
MSTLIADLSISLDGFVAGPNPSMNDPLGIGGMQLHEWAFAAMSWREEHGQSGGEKNSDSDHFDALRARVGAGIMGRKMYSGGSGPWEDDGNGRGWWGDEPPFHTPVFVLTSHAREPLELTGTTFTFVTDGIESAYEQAMAAAGGKDVQVHGGGSAVSQYLRAGLLDELAVHVAPVLLGSGTRLLQDVPPGKLEQRGVVESPAGVTHITYRVLR